MSTSLVRRLWLALETYHATVYFEPSSKEIYAAAGLKGYWMGYFASRAAALGSVPAEVVIATFYNFEPGKVRRAIPDAWTFASPEAVLQARLDVVDAALSTVAGELAEAAEIGLSVAEAADVAGRPLAAAHVATARPERPALLLWWAATVLREHRGDGHVALLVAEGIDGCEAHVLKHAAGESPDHDQMVLSRGWSLAQWDAATERLEARGLLAAGRLTPEGTKLRAHVEARTDELALQPYRAAGSERAERLVELVEPIADDIASRGTIPFPNPIGLTRPS